MSATVKISDKACFVCRSTEKTIHMKLKDGTFQGVVCQKHFYSLLGGREALPAEKSSAQSTEK